MEVENKVSFGSNGAQKSRGAEGGTQQIHGAEGVR